MIESVKFDIEFEFCYGASWPIIEFVDLDVSCQEKLSANETVKYVNYEFVTSNPTVMFKNINKTDNDTIIVNGEIVQDQVVKIKKIFVDDILINLELINHSMTFVPNYPQGYFDYCNQHNIVPDLVTHDTNLHFNGSWIFEFVLPFWKWYAESRLEKENFFCLTLYLSFSALNKVYGMR
jgi:hypothetical protein